MDSDQNSNQAAQPFRSDTLTVSYTFLVRDRGLAIFFERDPAPIPAEHELRVRITRSDGVSIDTVAYREFARKEPPGEVIAFLLPLLKASDVPVGSTVSILEPAVNACATDPKTRRQKKSSPAMPETEFRQHWGMVAFTIVGSVLIAADALYLYRQYGMNFYSVVAMLMTPLSVAGVADACLTRIVLRQDDIEIVSNFRRRVYPRSAFVAVTAGKGSPVRLQMAEGGCIRLPGVSAAGPGYIKTLNAWIKHRP